MKSSFIGYMVSPSCIHKMEHGKCRPINTKFKYVKKRLRVGSETGVYFRIFMRAGSTQKSKKLTFCINIASLEAFPLRSVWPAALRALFVIIFFILLFF